MKITVLTLFPEMFAGPFDHSILKRAKEKNLLEISVVNMRDFGQGKHKIVDDKPYGGGVGMVLKVDVLDTAIQSVKDSNLSSAEQKVILLDARGQTFTQVKAKELSILKHLILICGHYEGFDDRILNFVDEQISIGDFVLTGGEIPAMAICDAVARLVKGVLKEDATAYESFSEITKGGEFIVEHPQYTRPPVYKNHSVPKALLSGDHKKIQEWKKENARIKPTVQTE